jgi:LPXTG-site transpeptidase (sortase) family protein
METKKTLWKYFLFFFFLSFLILNWSKISWVFYPDYLWRVVHFYLFEKSTIEQENDQKLEIRKEKNENNTEKISKREDSIEIPKIKISAPLISVTSESEVSKALDRGVVLWPDSVKPGEKGETIILGHSAPENWPKIKYDWVFTNLNNLEKEDEIFVYFKNKKFRYSVKEKIFLKKGQEIPKIEKDINVLILISCWPPGKDLKRIAVISE